MADGYLEDKQLEYEKRKAAWLRKKKNTPSRRIERPDDEAL